MTEGSSFARSNTRFLRLLAILFAVAAMLPLAHGRGANAQDDLVRVATTTTQITDLVENVGGEHVAVEGIMGPGVDPHLYRASEGDLSTMVDSDVVFYNGLNLEGQMADILVQLAGDRRVVALGTAVPDEQRLDVPGFSGEYDPHVWFDPTLWMMAAQGVAETLAEVDPENADAYQSNAEAYIAELEELDAEAMEALSAIPDEQRVLVTAHDAFGYFGNRYDIEVVGIQGLSTETEAGVGDLQRVADLIIERGIPAIFVESTISPATIEAVQAAVDDRGEEVVIGGQLYSDAMGEADTPEGTYIGMFRHNIDTIVTAYAGDSTATPEG